MSLNPTFSMFNRPTKPGLYYVLIKLPIKISIADFRMYESKIELPEQDGIEAGLLVWDDAGSERALSFNAAKAHIEQGANIPSVRWAKKVAMIGKDGVVDAFAYYLHLKKAPPTLPGLADASETHFDSDGNFLFESDAKGRRFTASNAASLGAWDWQTPAAQVLIGLTAVAGGALLVSLFSAGLLTVGWLVALGLLLGTLAPVGIYYVQVSADPKRSGDLLKKGKDMINKTVTTIGNAAKWTVGILGLIALNNILEIIN